MFQDMSQSQTSDIHLWSDPQTGLQAVIAIHDTSRGPALGGCRFFPYNSSGDAIRDAIRLAQGMSDKAALAGIEQGGGKAVIMAPRDIQNQEALFLSFGRFVHSLGGRYITAMDVGTTTADMETIARVTPHVTCTSASGNPALYTALGVYHGILACLKACKDLPDSLNGVHVAVQGLGHVGYALCDLLHKDGAKLTVCDLDPEKSALCQKNFGATVVAAKEILSVDCDIFSPCGLGGVIGTSVAQSLKCRAVAGSANNQLATPEAGLALHRQNILCAPDFLINAGGLIHASLSHRGKTAAETRKRVTLIEQTILRPFNRQITSGEPPSLMADRMAEDILYSPKHQLEQLSA
ncbi:amino acid dehydrogenase [Sansalvadorimonas sp. 2012CJ34-2]|uniref:Amino acid dehydrogenase n=1 Tax=Parendozoicomonas callyspongiae TaxID=2942213 RepID=A0ABT0PEX4_9GAMM|nr:Glu/Leu/Phe/Val dehydrogenase dimerization domain-containing protein [Sansalvadorimonas sp. 2012CJ34-2]MCL6269761.1 amino acid dehydrogenase [Sansalvadorimonas sp. 2012CJ34-2]